MSDYRCWASDEGETQADAKTVRVSDGSGAREAAEIFAERKFAGDPFKAMEVSVLVRERVHLFVVDVVTDPSFVATEMHGFACTNLPRCQLGDGMYSSACPRAGYDDAARKEKP